MLKTLTLIIILFLSGCKSASIITPTGIPTTLEQAIARLESTMSKADLDKIAQGTEDDLYLYHHGFGTGLRNSWGLWKDSALAKWFHNKGVHHADDMSGVIITSLYRELNGLPWELEKQLAVIHEHWQAYETYKTQEAQKDIERVAKRKKAMLNWRWKTLQAPKAILPKQPKNVKDVWGLAPYNAGFIVTLKGWRDGFSPIWHDGIYFVESGTQQLKPIQVKGCDAIYDVVVIKQSATWLCKNASSWQLVTTHPSQITKSVSLNLPSNIEWLRLGKHQAGVLLMLADTIYQYQTGTLSVLYKANSQTRTYPIFDSDKKYDRAQSFFPQRSATPIKFANAIYFQVENTGNETDLLRLTLSKDDLVGAREIFINEYIGSWGISTSNINTLDYDALWVGSPKKGTLAKINKNGEVEFASLFNSLKLLEQISTYYTAPWNERLPTGAITFHQGKQYLASHNGIVFVENAEITPVVYFVYPEGVNRTPYVNSPQYSYHVKPQRLGVFNNGDFIIGDRFDGVYLLKKTADSYEFVLPSIVYTSYEIH